MEQRAFILARFPGRIKKAAAPVRMRRLVLIYPKALVVVVPPTLFAPALAGDLGMAMLVIVLVIGRLPRGAGLLAGPGMPGMGAGKRLNQGVIYSRSTIFDYKSDFNAAPFHLYRSMPSDYYGFFCSCGFRQKRFQRCDQQPQLLLVL